MAATGTAKRPPQMGGGNVAGFEAQFTVKPSEFGMKESPGLGDEVRVTVSVEGVRP